MEYYENIVLIKTPEIINVVRRSLSKIDPRLVEHGERVAYIARMICAEARDGAGLDPSRLHVLCVLHDIGAYKTDEIDKMVAFETDYTFDHSLYGYLFLKNTSHLAGYADALLYHHTDFSAPKSCLHPGYSDIIHLADRADIILCSGEKSLSTFKAMAGSRFDPEHIEALFRAEKRRRLSKKLASGLYRSETRDFEATLDIKSGEIMDYLKLLVYAIDFRSPYTVTHTADTTVMSLEIGRLMGLSEHQLRLVYIGAFLHDIGKIAIPHSILEKPGRLTDDEFEIVKEHINEGGQILRGVVSEEICDIALRHHEKPDGSGYPLGLAGGQLTLPQRIVAAADILSALSQRRSYKEPYPKEQVISILEEMSASGKLCPRVSAAVCLNYDRILQSAEKSHDPVKTLYSSLMSEYASLRAGHRASLSPVPIP